MSKEFSGYLEAINTEIANHRFGEQPTNLYEPIRYIMSLGGKRLRPALALLGYRLFAKDAERIIPTAIAVEVFHNFTLMHDDIMDRAPLRRGKPTVHEKWSMPTAILSGDIMLVKAYELFMGLKPEQLVPALTYFNTCAAEVCEGQQEDMDFETRETVPVEEYIEMIRKKTAVLLGYSLRLGAILADASAQEAQQLNEFGVNIGLGFQLMDDLLDVYADAAKFGKQVGGDIISNKKTWLLITALKQANPEQRKQLDYWLGLQDFDPQEKVAAVKDIYQQLNIRQQTEALIEEYFAMGFAQLDAIEVPAEDKQPLIEFTNYLANRDT